MVEYPRLVQALLVEPGVEFYSQFLQVLSCLNEALRHSLLAQGPSGFQARHTEEAVTVFFGKLLSHFRDVLSLVAILWEWLVPAQGLGIAHVDTVAEMAHLGSRIVDIVFPLHLKARRAQNGRQGIADNRVAGGGDRDRPCGVGAHKLDLNRLALPKLKFAEILPFLEDGFDLRRQPRWGQRKVDIAWSRYFDLAQERCLWEVSGHLCGDLSRGHPYLSCQL